VDVRIKSDLAFGLMSMIGALPGVWLNRLIAGKVLLILFGFLMIAVAVTMLCNKTAQNQLQTARIPSEAYTRRNWFRLLVLGLVVGLLTGFFGMGGGSSLCQH
jgi:uncharacterized membrane protein YfcA